jgi:hypothetical protein
MVSRVIRMLIDEYHGEVNRKWKFMCLLLSTDLGGLILSKR